MKNKKILITIIVIIAVILLIPIPMRLKDGGSIKYQAVLYSITKYHKLNHETENGYIDGIGIEILGVEILNTTDKKIETHTITEERIKLSDLKIKAEGVDTTKLVKFNGTIYGKSFAIIDYAGNLNKTIGQIDFLIDEEYLPQLDGETNYSDFLGAGVLEANEKSMVLNIKNEAVLFNAIDKSNIRKTNGELLFDGENEQTPNNVVDISISGVENLEELNEFIGKMDKDNENRTSDTITIIQYTIEGDKIYTTLNYIKESEAFELIIDNREDKFAAEENRKITKNTYSAELYEIVKEERDEYIDIKLTANDYFRANPLPEDIIICSYNKKYGTTE